MEKSIQGIISEFLPHKAASSASASQNVGGVERIASGILGVWLLSRAFRARGIGKVAALVPAAAALKRAFSGKCEMYQAMGISSVAEEGQDKNRLNGANHRQFGQQGSDSVLKAPLGEVAGAMGGSSLHH